MAISHETKWFGVNDAKIRTVDTDPTGGAATYGARIDVPGIKSVGFTGDVITNELRGDGIRLDQNSNLGGLNMSFEFAKQSLDIMSALAGGAVVDAGSGSTETSGWKITKNSRLNYFEFEAQTLGVDLVGGDGHIVASKVILTSFPELGFAEEDYKTYTVEGALMPLLATGDVLSVLLNETAVPIPAT